MWWYLVGFAVFGIVPFVVYALIEWIFTVNSVINTYISVESSDGSQFVKCIEKRYQYNSANKFTYRVSREVICAVEDTVVEGIEYDLLLLCLVILCIENCRIMDNYTSAYNKVRTYLTSRGYGDSAKCSFTAAIELLDIVEDIKNREGYSLTEGTKTHSAKVQEAYSDLNQQIAPVAFPGGIEQVETVLSSLAIAYDIDLSKCDSDEYKSILESYLKVYVRYTLSDMEPWRIFTTLLVNNNDLIIDNKTALKVLAYSLLNIRQPSFSLNNALDVREWRTFIETLQNDSEIERVMRTHDSIDVSATNPLDEIKTQSDDSDIAKINSNSKKPAFCRECGAHLSEEMRFCPYCGTKVLSQEEI